MYELTLSCRCFTNGHLDIPVSTQSCVHLQELLFVTEIQTPINDPIFVSLQNINTVANLEELDFCKILFFNILATVVLHSQTSSLCIMGYID